MPTSGEAPDVLVDTSVAVALCVGDHQFHTAVNEALRGRRLGLAGHAAFETYSVLTRLPPPGRRSPAAVSEILRVNFSSSRFLSAAASAKLIDEVGRGAIAGGAVYDALVAACAAEHEIVLATLDRRALDTYRAVGAQIEVLL
jgi:predicted nucleic acid-binding protein